MDQTKRFWLTYKVMTPIMWIIGILIIYFIQPEHLRFALIMGIGVSLPLSLGVNYLAPLIVPMLVMIVITVLNAGWDGFWTSTIIIILLTWTSYPMTISRQHKRNPYYLKPKNQTIHEFLKRFGEPLPLIPTPNPDLYWNFVGGPLFANSLPVVLISDGLLAYAVVATDKKVLHGIFYTSDYLRWSQNGVRPQVTPNKEKPRTFLEPPQVFMVDKKMIQPLVKIKLS